MMKRTSGKRWLWALAGTTVVLVAWAFLPYWLPATVALGPCGRDWTSLPNYGRRQSPTGTALIPVGARSVKVCYGRPQARNRQVFGRLVPWGQRWRMGANEPTRLFTADSLTVGSVAVGPGRYRLYAIVRPDTWTVVINGNTFAWGNDFSAAVLQREVGRFRVVPESTVAFVESLTVVPVENGMAFDWERTRVVLPLR